MFQVTEISTTSNKQTLFDAQLKIKLKKKQRARFLPGYYLLDIPFIVAKLNEKLIVLAELSQALSI